MNHLISRLVIALALALVVALSVGCKRKSSSTASSSTSVQEAAQKLPEGANVLAALDQKDYEAALSSLAKAREGATDDQGRVYFAELKQHVNERLMEAMQNDPKAEEAYRAFRIMLMGR